MSRQESLDDGSAVQFVINPLIAWIMTTQERALRPREWLLQTAAGSTLGRVVLQIAPLRGFKTSNVVPRREQAEELKGLGADDEMRCVHPSTRRWSGGVCLEQQRKLSAR